MVDATVPEDSVKTNTVDQPLVKSADDLAACDQQTGDGCASGQCCQLGTCVALPPFCLLSLGCPCGLFCHLGQCR
ncbi:hypothetical protein JB92DRAFT_518480 [Gautieria morchelliformis]|nr:hypothetical protein JB92DRAFT_518480 [Gautieria morchelliformis]